jgi:hypothetical protein
LSCVFYGVSVYAFCAILIRVNFAEQDAEKDSEKIEILAILDFVAFGGGPLDKAVGDKLISEGVNLRVAYGA